MDGCVYERSDYLLSNAKEIRAFINSMDLTYDGKRIRWTKSFEELQKFVADVLEEQGNWSPKVSCSRKFTSSISDLGLTWYYTKQKTLLFQGQHGTELKEALINLCESPTSIESIRSKAVLLDNNIEIVSAEENTASASTIINPDAESCNCPCVNGILIELENIKLNMDIVESRTDALQSLANAQKVSFTSNECSSEISRLRQQLFEERHRTSQLESDLASLKKKFFHFEQKYRPNLKPQIKKANFMAKESLSHKQFSSTHSANENANKGKSNLCIDGINLPLIDLPNAPLSHEPMKSSLKANKERKHEQSRFPNQSISTTEVNNVSHMLQMTQPHDQSTSRIIVNNNNIPEIIQSSTTSIVNTSIIKKENSMLGKVLYSEKPITMPTVNEQLINKTDHANKNSTQLCNSRIDFNRLPLIEIPVTKLASSLDKVNKDSNRCKTRFPNQSTSTILYEESHTSEVASPQDQSASMAIADNNSTPESTRSSKMPFVNMSIVNKENSTHGVIPYSDQLSSRPAVSPFRLRSREKHRLTKNQDWLNYLDFVRKKTRNLTKQY